MRKLTIILYLCILTSAIKASDPSNKIEGIWLTSDENSKIKISKTANGLFIGQIIWLRVPNYKNGSPKVDFRNPIDSLKKQLLINLVILNKLQYNKDEVYWNNGTIYDPNSGHTYSCKMWFDENDSILNVRGYIGFSILGKHVTWKRSQLE